MKKMIAFFEIPSIDFKGTVRFHETLFSISMPVYENETEKMAFFPEEDGKCPGAISQAKDFKSSTNGFLISLQLDNMGKALDLVGKNGGKITRHKTKIEVEGRRYFAIFTDPDGNRMGLYSDK